MSKRQDRAPKREMKKNSILIRVSDREKQMIDNIAKAHGMKTSQYIRAMALLNVSQKLDV